MYPHISAPTCLVPGQKLHQRHTLKIPALHSTLISLHGRTLQDGLASDSTGWGRGVSCVFDVGETGPLSKDTQFSHSLSLCQEPPQKYRVPQITAGCSLQSPHQQLGTRQCTPEAGAIAIGMLVPGKVASEYPKWTESTLIFSIIVYAVSSSHLCCSG